MSSSQDRAPRVSLMMMGQVLRGDCMVSSLHRISNLSRTGVRLAQAANLAVGDALAVQIGSIDWVPATVVWSRDGFAGIAFAHPIDVEQARLRREQPSPPPLTAGWLADLRDAYGRR